MDEKTYLEAIENGEMIDRAMKEAVQKALREHKRRGQYIIVWPKLDLIVVMTAYVQDANWNLAGLLEKFVLPAVKGSP